MSKKNTFLWRLNSTNDGYSYLFGTMHIAEGLDIEGLEKIKELIQQCHVFANEMDLDHGHLIPSNTIHMTNSLKELIGSKKFEKQKKIFLRAFQIDLENFQFLKPLIITNMIAEIILGKSGKIGLDHYLFEYAKQQNIETTGIEKASTQAEIMNNIPIEYQVKALSDIARNVSKFRKKVLELSQLYQEKNLPVLHKKAKRSLGGLRKTLLYDRNINMAQIIKSMIDDNTCFIAVGAGHLYGGKGVLRLLKEKGVSIKPILY